MANKAEAKSMVTLYANSTNRFTLSLGCDKKAISACQEKCSDTQLVDKGFVARKIEWWQSQGVRESRRYHASCGYDGLDRGHISTGVLQDKIRSDEVVVKVRQGSSRRGSKGPAGA